MKTNSILLTCFALLLFTVGISCKKDNNTPAPTTTGLTGDILTNEANNVIQANYNDLANRADSLYLGIVAFQSSQTATNLANCKRLWINDRKDYEQSEGFLIGPVVYDNIDPDVDTWPIDSTSIDSLLQKGPAEFTQGFVDSLSEGLKGFHPIEYLLYGNGGSKTVNEFTARQFQFMVALALNVKTLTAQIAGLWNPQTSGNYYTQFITAGSGSTVYSTQKAAFQDLVNAMMGICDEVGNQKMEIPFIQKNASLEESHYSNNSLADFRYNIIGLQNVYLGQFTTVGQVTTTGNGISNLVMQYNLSLDATIKGDINAAISALNGITVPFGQAITQQPTQVQNAINAINVLNTELQNNLLPFVQKYTN